MAEFCKCGSIMIQGNCTNKHCSNKTEKVAAPKSRTSTAKASAAGTTATKAKTESKSTNVRRASKCITYSINDLPKEEE